MALLLKAAARGHSSDGFLCSLQQQHVLWLRLLLSPMTAAHSRTDILQLQRESEREQENKKNKERE